MILFTPITRVAADSWLADILANPKFQAARLNAERSKTEQDDKQLFDGA